VGPATMAPTKPAVDVLTPSIDSLQNATSSTYTPGAMYSGKAAVPQIGRSRVDRIVRILCMSALGIADDAFHQPVHRPQFFDGQPLPFWHPQPAFLVVQRSAELVELA
jgi:hypothetical protein